VQVFSLFQLIQSKIFKAAITKSLQYHTRCDQRLLYRATNQYKSMSSTEYSATNVPQDVTNLIVTRFRLVAHTMGPVTPGAALSQNHWSIYLLHENGSVRLNMILADPRAASTRGRLRVTSHGYTTVSTSAVRHWDFGATNNLAVYYVIQLILDNRRAEYDMNARGVGCRYWM
jgi:hypothetical protein